MQFEEVQTKDYLPRELHENGIETVLFMSPSFPGKIQKSTASYRIADEQKTYLKAIKVRQDK